MNKQSQKGLINILRSILIFTNMYIIDFLKEIQLRFYRYNKSPNKKILAYWDFNKRNETLGDFIVFLKILNVLRFKSNLYSNRKNIDICFIDDANHYNSKNKLVSKTHAWKKNIKSLPIINPYIDNIFCFGSNAEFERFYAQNRKRYIRWPNELISNLCDGRIVYSFYKKKEFKPELRLPVEIISRIYKFYESFVYPSLPIIVNIRRNTRSIERNSNLKELKRFIKHYEKKESYKFVIICEKAEIPEDFRKLNNVIFSKDYFNDIEYDLGLIQTSYLSIFPSSGMSTFAWFTKTPLIQYGRHMENQPCIPSKGKKFKFLSKYQRFHHRIETAKWLISEFNRLVKDLKENNINNNLKNKTKDNKKYLAEF